LTTTGCGPPEKAPLFWLTYRAGATDQAELDNLVDTTTLYLLYFQYFLYFEDVEFVRALGLDVPEGF
jgi:hypothetical protein